MRRTMTLALLAAACCSPEEPAAGGGLRTYEVRALEEGTDRPLEIARVGIVREGVLHTDPRREGPLTVVAARPGEEVLAHVVDHALARATAGDERVITFRARRARTHATLSRTSNADEPWRIGVMRGVPDPLGGETDLVAWTEVEWRGERLEVATPDGFGTHVRVHGGRKGVYLPGFPLVAPGEELLVRRVPDADVTVRMPGADPHRTVVATADRDGADDWTPEEVDALYAWNPALEVRAELRQGVPVLPALPPIPWHVFGWGSESGFGYAYREGTGESVTLTTSLVRVRGAPSVGGTPLRGSAVLLPGRLDTESLTVLERLLGELPENHPARDMRIEASDLLATGSADVLDVPVHTAVDHDLGIAYLERDEEGRLSARAWEPGCVSVSDPATPSLHGHVELVRMLPSSDRTSIGSTAASYRRRLEGDSTVEVRGLPLGHYRATVRYASADRDRIVEWSWPIRLSTNAPRVLLTPPP
jgi:hypothetical protein